MAPFTPTDVYDRFLFNTREQVIGEPIDVFVDSLKTLSKNCKYEGASDQFLSLLIRDRFIIGMRDKNVQYDLLQYESNDLPLEKAVELAKQQQDNDDLVRVKTEAPDEAEQVDKVSKEPQLKEEDMEGLDEEDILGFEDEDYLGFEEDEPVQCLLCKDVFENHKKLNSHMRVIHKQNERKPVRCEECDVTLSNVYKLKQHMFRKHRQILNCKVCKELCENKADKSKLDLKKHIESAHKSEMSTMCLICKKSYSDKYALKCHMKRLHGDLMGKDGQGKVCKLCDETVADLKLHMETKHDDTGMKCKICNKQLRQDESLRMHFIQMHSKAGKTVCQYCGESFTNIEAHVATLHMTEKPFKCDKCDYSHATKVGLKNHKLYFHPKGNAHMCHICPYKSHHKSNLKQHIQVVHEKERPFQCPQCNKCFFHKGAMQDHINGMPLHCLQNWLIHILLSCMYFLKLVNLFYFDICMVRKRILSYSRSITHFCILKLVNPFFTQLHSVSRAG